MMNHGDVMGTGRHKIDVWHVRLASGETRTLSLDELAAGFQSGWIDARTPVLPAGALRWAPLGEVAGLDEEDESPPVPSMPNSIAPLALDSYGTDVPFDVDVPFDTESDPDVLAFRPRRGRTIFRVMTALVVVTGLGIAAFRGRPMLQRALASRTAAKAAPAVVVTAPPAPVLVAPPAIPIVSPEPAPAIATLSTTSLPDAPLTAEEKKAAAAEAKKAKRAASKRAPR
jgi:hypothetical protein